jgi:hypothetical protein
MPKTKSAKSTRKSKRGGVWLSLFGNKPAANTVENKPAQVTEKKEFEFTCLTVHYDYDTSVVEIIGVLKVENCPFLFRASGFLTENREDGYSNLCTKIDEYFGATYPHLLAKMKSVIRDEILAKKKQIYPKYEDSLKISRIDWGKDIDGDIDGISIEINQNTISYCVAKKLEDAITKYIVSQYALIKKGKAIGIKTKVSNKIEYDGRDVDLLKSFIDYLALLEMYNKQSDLSELAQLDITNRMTNRMSGGMGTQVAATLFVVLFMAATNAISTSNTVFTNTNALTTKKIKGDSTFLDNRTSRNTQNTIKDYNAITSQFVNDLTSFTTDTMLENVTYDNCETYLYCVSEIVPSQTVKVVQELRTTYNIPESVKSATIITDAIKVVVGPTGFNYDDKSDILSITENQNLLTPEDAIRVVNALITDITRKIAIHKNDIGTAVLRTQPYGEVSVITSFDAFAKTFNEMNTATKSAKPIPFFSGDKNKINSMVDKYIEIVNLTNQLELLNEVKTMQTVIQGSSDLNVDTIDDLTTFNINVRNLLKKFGQIYDRQAAKLKRTANITSYADTKDLINTVHEGSVVFLKKLTTTMAEYTKENMRQSDMLTNENMHTYWSYINQGVQIIAGILTLAGAAYGTYVGISAMWLSAPSAGTAISQIVMNLMNNVAAQSTLNLKQQQIERAKKLVAVEHSLEVFKKDLKKLNNISPEELKKAAHAYGLVMEDTNDLPQIIAALEEKINEQIKTHESAIAALKEHVNANIEEKAGNSVIEKKADDSVIEQNAADSVIQQKAGNYVIEKKADDSVIKQNAAATFQAVANRMKEQIEAAIKIQKVARGYIARKQTKKQQTDVNKQSGGRKRKSVRKSRKH